MAKFSQNQDPPKNSSATSQRQKPVQGDLSSFPKKTKGAPIQDALQKTGADLTIIGSAEEFLVTKAHVFCPFHSR